MCYQHEQIQFPSRLQANQTNNLRALVPLGNPTMSQTAVKRQVLTGVVDTLFRPTPSHLISKKKILGPIESIPLGQTSDKIALDNTYETSHMVTSYCYSDANE